MTDADFETRLSGLIERMAGADPLYRPTSFWEVGVKEFLAELRGQGVERFRAWESSRRFFVPTYAAPGHAEDPARFGPVVAALEAAGAGGRHAEALRQFLSGRSQALADYRVFLASDAAGLPPRLDGASESAFGEPVEQFVFGGKRFSRSFLNYLLGLCFLKRHADTGPIRRVMEIGGGFGTLGEILLGDRSRDYFYIDIDLPTTGLVAHRYLSEAAWEGAVLCPSEAERTAPAPLLIDELAARHRAAVLCPWQIERIEGSIDLFVNFISFQEMEPAVVRNYLRHVVRLAPRYVLLRNIREGQRLKKGDGLPGVEQPILGEDYDVFLPGYRPVAVNTHPFGHETPDGFHSELRLYVRG